MSAVQADNGGSSSSVRFFGNRHQAFSLLVKAYEQARRAVEFVRWNEDDVDEIAPSLYAGRTGTRRKNGSDVAKASSRVRQR